MAAPVSLSRIVISVRIVIDPLFSLSAMAFSAEELQERLQVVIDNS